MIMKDLKVLKANIVFDVCRVKSKIAAKSHNAIARTCNYAGIRNAFTDKVVNGLAGMYNNGVVGQLKALEDLHRLID